MRLSIITSVQIWRMLLWCLSDWLKPRNVLSPHQREIFINWEVMWGRGSTKKHSQLKDGVIIFVSSQRWDITLGHWLGFSLSVRTDTKQFYNWRVLSFFPRTSDQRIEKHIWERLGIEPGSSGYSSHRSGHKSMTLEPCYDFFSFKVDHWVEAFSLSKICPWAPTSNVIIRHVALIALM